MQIAINDMSQKSLVCVVVEGFCNHFDYELERVPVDSIGSDGEYAQYESEVLVCQRCGAYNPQDGLNIWEDANALN